MVVQILLIILNYTFVGIKVYKKIHSNLVKKTSKFTFSKTCDRYNDYLIDIISQNKLILKKSIMYSGKISLEINEGNYKVKVIYVLL